jgi:hypothetical protein
MDTKPFVSLMNVVTSYKNEVGNYDTANDFRYLNIVKEGFTEMNIYNTTHFQTYRGTVNSAGILSLPSDYINYILISIVYQGQLWTLTKNNSIDFTQKGACLIDVADVNNTDEIIRPQGLSYAKGGGVNVGEYRVDNKARKITFNGTMNGVEVVVDYESTGISMSEKTYIPIKLLPVLKNYLDKILAVRDTTLPEYRVKAKEVRFINSLRKYERSEKMPTPDEVLDVLRSGYSQSIKR